MKKNFVKKTLKILNSKPVIGIGIFIMLSLAMVFAGNVFVKEGSVTVEENLNVSNDVFVGTLQADKIYSLEGTITTTSATTILTRLERGDIWQVYASGYSTDYASSDLGYGTWIVTRVYDAYMGTDIVRVLPLFTTNFNDKIVVSGYGASSARMQYDEAGAGNRILYWSALKVH